MVYHYTNFIWETNAWWLRRVRPVENLSFKLKIKYIFPYKSFGCPPLVFMYCG